VIAGGIVLMIIGAMYYGSRVNRQVEGAATVKDRNVCDLEEAPANAEAGTRRDLLDDSCGIAQNSVGVWSAVVLAAVTDS
jgi:hypothetical protein